MSTLIEKGFQKEIQFKKARKKFFVMLANLIICLTLSKAKNTLSQNFALSVKISAQLFKQFLSSYVSSFDHVILNLLA